MKGTGIKANIEGLDIGGKTGSATGNEGKTHGWFVGFFSIGEKEYTMMIFTPNINSVKVTDSEALGGGDTAAPVFKDIVKKLNMK